MPKNYPKRRQIAKFSMPLQEIDVAENDGDNKFQTGSTNNAETAHAQRKMAKNGRKRFPITEIAPCYRKLNTKTYHFTKLCKSD